MNNVYLKGVLDAKISNLLTESDFATFANLSGMDRLNFFINNELVSTSIVTNFEALCKFALSDLKEEVSLYTKNDPLYVNYFFAHDVIKKDQGALRDFYNETYEKALQRKEEALVNYLDYTHALLNILTLVRGKKRGDTTASLLANYLKQGVLSEETFSALVNGDTHTIYAYLKNNFNIDASESESTVELEEKLDEYLFNKLKILAMDSDFKPTLIYYIKRKQLQIERLRNIVYTKRNG